VLNDDYVRDDQERAAIQRSALHGQQAGSRRAERRRDRNDDCGDRWLLVVAWTELWKRTVRGSIERLPDPARHPECWFRII